VEVSLGGTSNRPTLRSHRDRVIQAAHGMGLRHRVMLHLSSRSLLLNWYRDVGSVLYGWLIWLRVTDRDCGPGDFVDFFLLRPTRVELRCPLQRIGVGVEMGGLGM
jgi:hypothetical protein